MSKFTDWFHKSYERWNKSRHGAEDFLAFCDLLGYSSATVLSWMDGDSIPRGAEVLSIAGVLGIKAYEVLDQPAPDPGLLKIYNSFHQLKGEFRTRLAQALWEVQKEMEKNGSGIGTEQTKSIIAEAFARWGLSSLN
ncbi:MAG: hypothetical protein WCK35_09000 [Chloroflexota bacterium]